MLTIAGGIILAIVILVVGAWLFGGIIKGFSDDSPKGCLVAAIFAVALVTLAMCVFG